MFIHQIKLALSHPGMLYEKNETRSLPIWRGLTFWFELCHIMRELAECFNARTTATGEQQIP